MAKKRREKTLADYVVIAISPVLIMTLVGSLAFFLLELSYHGQFEIRMKWILFCFVSASVLVARIAIEQGKEHASLFGFALVGVVGFAAMRLVDNFLVAWVLLAISWCCTWKLTWDCTLIDDDEDASGEGLLQAAGLNSATGTLRVPSAATGTANGRERDRMVSDEKRRAKLSSGEEERARDDRGTEPLAPHPGPSPRAGEGEAVLGGRDGDSGASSRRVHAPGRWVVYFSLAALPLFGAGQLLIPARETASRAYAFGLLALYVASALGLLLTTSFLGLRRYLRQRKLQMPGAMTGAWLGMGTGLAIALLLLALLLPQPQGEYTLTTLVDKADAKIREASRFAVVHGDRAQGEGRRVGEQDQKAGQPGNIQRQDQKPADQNPEGKGGQADGQQKQGDQKQNGGDGKEARGDGRGEKTTDGRGEEKKDGNDAAKGQGQGAQKQNRDQKQNQEGKNGRPGDRQQAANRPPQPPQEARGDGKNSPPPSPGSSGTAITNALQSMAPYFKWLVYGVLALVAIYVVIRHWSRFLEILAQLWAELLSLFGFKGERETEGKAEGDAPPAVAVRPFAAYANPFFSGAAQRMSPAQLVRYTFEALEAWSREQVVARPPEQTPLEFAQELGRRIPALAKDVAATAELYVRVAYARKNPSREAVEVLERLWRRIGMGAGV